MSQAILERQDPSDEWYEVSQNAPGCCPTCGEEYDDWKGAMCDCEDEAEEDEAEEAPSGASHGDSQAERIEAAKAVMNQVTRKHRKGYDPGVPGRIESEGHGCYVLESFRESGVYYRVDLTEATCSCPDHLYRGLECKHIRRCRVLAFNEAQQTAAKADTETLNNLLLFKYSDAYRPEIAEAIRVELHFRETAHSAN